MPIAARCRSMPRACTPSFDRAGGRPRGRLLTKLDADAAVGTPHHVAMSRPIIAVEKQIEIVRNPDRSCNRKTSAALRDIARGAIDRGTAPQKRNLGALENTMARKFSAFRHSLIACCKILHRLNRSVNGSCENSVKSNAESSINAINHAGNCLHGSTIAQSKRPVVRGRVSALATKRAWPGGHVFAWPARSTA